VAAVSAVQELTAPRMQARVMSVLESSGAAMPGVGYLVGGAATHALDPRATFVLAGSGVVAIALVAAPLIGRNWPAGTGSGPSNKRPDGSDDAVMVQLSPAISPPEGGSPTTTGGKK
jgi:hypothetical protein